MASLKKDVITDYTRDAANCWRKFLERTTFSVRIVTESAEPEASDYRVHVSTNKVRHGYEHHYIILSFRIALEECRFYVQQRTRAAKLPESAFYKNALGNWSS